MNAAILINQDSGDFEYYSPERPVEAARRTMGRIELDPFSSVQANLRIKADRIFTIHDNGLIQPWETDAGWINHPFGRQMNPLCVSKMELEYNEGRMKQACAITFAATSERWFQSLLSRPQCFLYPRTNYYMPDGTLKVGVTKGSCVTYFGTNVVQFVRNFSPLGVVKLAA